MWMIFATSIKKMWYSSCHVENIATSLQSTSNNNATPSISHNLTDIIFLLKSNPTQNDVVLMADNSNPNPNPAATRFRVGYALSPKKQRSFIRETLITAAGRRSIDFIKIDADKPLIEQGPFDIILHKLYDQNWKQQLSDYISKNPKIIIIDDLDSIAQLHNRISMLKVVSELNSTEIGIPKQIMISDVETTSYEESMADLKFPVIAKPLMANGSEKSHKMSLVYNQEGLTNLIPPIVLQEFVNHGGVIFKVYVVGEHVECVKRSSLRDISDEYINNLAGGEGSVSFSQISNKSSDEGSGNDVEEPSRELVLEVAKGLRDGLKLNLFNFDVIRDNKAGGKYLVIDINYFPGFEKMSNYETVFAEFLSGLLAEKTDLKADNNGGSQEL